MMFSTKKQLRKIYGSKYLSSLIDSSNKINSIIVIEMHKHYNNKMIRWVAMIKKQNSFCF